MDAALNSDMPEIDEASAPERRPIRSFVRREGRLTPAQKDALERLWSRYGLDAPPQPLDGRTTFGREAPLTLEIGFGAGHHLLARAAAEPERDFVGVEVHRPGVGRVLAQAEAAGLDNLRIACFDAVEVLRDWIAPLALDELVIEFPDPWHKKRHHKRRLIQPDFVKLAVSRLRCGGHLRLATDWAHYAAQMLDVLTAEATLRNTAKGYAARPASRPVTRFEARGERLGHEVFDLDFIKLEDASALAGSRLPE